MVWTDEIIIYHSVFPHHLQYNREANYLLKKMAKNVIKTPITCYTAIQT